MPSSGSTGSNESTFSRSMPKDFDLEVLRGGDKVLSAGRVAFVLAEVGLHPGDSRHVLFDDVREFLCAGGFYVYGFYDQNLEWSGTSRLRFANLCFANEAAFPR